MCSALTHWQCCSDDRPLHLAGAASKRPCSQAWLRPKLQHTFFFHSVVLPARLATCDTPFFFRSVDQEVQVETPPFQRKSAVHYKLAWNCEVQP
mmetsp:Transcript_45153/g.104631  ORF Transcript_45153/g.104631 Transcript_45153/m.104631 type:complete len:94 (-) Transcript_45153:59-340(-)